MSAREARTGGALIPCRGRPPELVQEPSGARGEGTARAVRDRAWRARQARDELLEGQRLARGRAVVLLWLFVCLWFLIRLTILFIFASPVVFLVCTIVIGWPIITFCFALLLASSCCLRLVLLFEQQCRHHRIRSLLLLRL